MDFSVRATESVRLKEPLWVFFAKITFFFARSQEMALLLQLSFSIILLAAFATGFSVFQIFHPDHRRNSARKASSYAVVRSKSSHE